MIVDDIKHTMEYIEKVTQELGYSLPKKSYYFEDAGCPHRQSSLPKGYAAIYIFVYESEVKCEYLKIGKANAKSNARFSSQHYGFNAKSTLAKAICGDDEFCKMGINQENIKEWMLNNLHRVNIFISTEQGKATTELVEAMLHYKFRPKYEGNI